jgi:hypothetical protein
MNCLQPMYISNTIYSSWKYYLTNNSKVLWVIVGHWELIDGFFDIQPIIFKDKIF